MGDPLVPSAKYSPGCFLDEGSAPPDPVIARNADTSSASIGHHFIESRVEGLCIRHIAPACLGFQRVVPMSRQKAGDFNGLRSIAGHREESRVDLRPGEPHMAGKARRDL